MTTFKHVLQVIWQPKWRLINQVLGFWVLILAIASGFSIHAGGWDHFHLSNVITFLLFLSVVASFILLARQTEHLLVSDTYRLLPTSETQLYLTNLLAMFGALAYFEAIQGIVLGLSIWLDAGSPLRAVWHLSYHGSQSLPVVLTAMGVIGILWILWAFVMITLIHLTANVLSSFLPNVQQRLIKLVLVILLVGLILFINHWLGNLLGTLMGGSSDALSMWAPATLLAILSAGGAALNVYLLQHWAEA